MKIQQLIKFNPKDGTDLEYIIRQAEYLTNWYNNELNDESNNPSIVASVGELTSTMTAMGTEVEQEALADMMILLHNLGINYDITLIS